MKIHYTLSGLTLSGLGAMAMALMLPFAACNSTSEQSAVTAKVSDTPTVKSSPIRHDSLSPSQIAKIKVIHKTFSEVDNSTLDEMITNFKKDRNPDSEIAVWEDMGNAYNKFITKSTAKPDLAKKQEAFKLILLRS